MSSSMPEYPQLLITADPESCQPQTPDLSQVQTMEKLNGLPRAKSGQWGRAQTSQKTLGQNLQLLQLS